MSGVFRQRRGTGDGADVTWESEPVDLVCRGLTDDGGSINRGVVTGWCNDVLDLGRSN